jgi:hypothetical protein
MEYASLSSHRTCGSYQDFPDRGLLLTRKLLEQEFLLVKLKSSLRKLYGRQHDLVDRYVIYVTNDHRWVNIKIHALFCYYAIKRQISTKLIGENMFCMKAHQPSIVLSSKSRLVQLRIYTCYTKTCFFLDVTCYFSRMTYFWSIALFRRNDFIRSLYCF